MNIYTGIYNLLEQYIFGAITSGSYQELVAIFFSTLISLGAILVPLWLLVKLIGRFIALWD